MLTLLHISIALVSVAYLTFIVLSRKQHGFKIAYATVIATLGSGILLMVIRPETLSHVCASGTVYLAVASAAIAFAKYRQAKYFTA